MGERSKTCPLIEVPPADVEPVKCEDCKTIIALKAALEPVKRGKWIPVENDLDYYPFMCSECFETVLRKTAYCPNCGAKMETEE